MNVVIVEDKESLRLIEKFMGYPNEYLSSIIDWNNLMPVVTKIEKTVYGKRQWVFRVVIEKNFIQITRFSLKIPGGSSWVSGERFDDNEGSTCKTKHKIHALFIAVIEFLNWYYEGGAK